MNNEEIVLYHGTNAIFDKFEKMGNRLTSIGTGHYFTPDLNIAKQYGKYIKSIKINKNDILDLDNPTKAQKEAIIKLLDEVVPNEIKAGYGEVKKIDITTMENKEAIALYKQKKEETKNLWHDRAKAQIVEDFETKKAYIQWQEAGLQNANTQNIKNLIQEYRQSIPKELGYKIAKSGSEIAIYDTNLVNQNLIEDKNDNSALEQIRNEMNSSQVKEEAAQTNTNNNTRRNK